MPTLPRQGYSGRWFQSRRAEVAFWAVALVAILAIASVLQIWQRDDRMYLSFLSGNPTRGARLFSGFGCHSCHSLLGVGPSIGPDLGKAPPADWDPVRLVSDMWSHSPQMWEKMREAQLGLPRISQNDMLDLLSYLYLIRYVDQPGDSQKGKTLFTTKGCSRCHAFSDESKAVGPNLAQVEGDTPIIWAQRMWNHRRGMSEAMAEKDVVWPTFRGQEMVDLLTYIQETNSGKRREGELFPADPGKGKKLFEEKGCTSCHSINGSGKHTGPDLGSQHQTPPSITQFAGLMWNHSPQMLAKMDQNLIGRSQFAEREMADLIAYLYVVRYLEPVGRVDAGKEVFNQKHCANCHGSEGKGGKGGPNLASRAEYFAPQIAYTLWSHGPEMYRKMRDKNIAWPTLNEKELVDLMAFLNSL